MFPHEFFPYFCELFWAVSLLAQKHCGVLLCLSLKEDLFGYEEGSDSTAPKCKTFCQFWRQWLQRVLNNATSSYCIKVWCSCSVIGYGLGLTTVAWKTCQSWTECRTRQCESYSEPPTNANQTESGAGQSILQCRWKSPQPTPWSHERHKGMQTGTGQVLDGSSRGLNTASAVADRTRANQGVGKIPKSIPGSLWDTPARKLGKALSRMARGKTESKIKLLIQENGKPQELIVYTDGSVTKDQSGWGFTVKQGATTMHEDSAAYTV